MQQASGVQIIPQDQFVAEDKEELDEFKMMRFMERKKEYK